MSNQQKAPLFAPLGKSDYRYVDLGDFFTDDFFAEDLDYSLLLNDVDEGGADKTLGRDEGSKGLSLADVGNFDLDTPVGGLTPLGHPNLVGAAASSSSSSQAGGWRRAAGGTAPGRQAVIMIPPSMPTQSTMRTMQKTSTTKSSARAAGGATKASSSRAKPVMDDDDDDDDDDGGGEDDDDSDDDDGGGGRGKKRQRKKPRTSGSGGDKHKVERRERNREHAKRSRNRKKVLLDLLQDQLEELRKENKQLRCVVTERLPALAPQILTDCTTLESGLKINSDEEDEGDDDEETIHFPGEPRERGRDKTDKEVCVLMEPDYRLIQALLTSQQNFVLSDPSLPDNPIVYCSDGFCRLSGYKRHEVLGRNCRFLQGPGTDQKAVDMIRKGVQDGTDMSVCLLNYRADGSTFWNQFFVAAIRDSDGVIVNYVGVQCEVNTPAISAIKARIKHLPVS